MVSIDLHITSNKNSKNIWKFLYALIKYFSSATVLRAVFMSAVAVVGNFRRYSSKG